MGHCRGGVQCLYMSEFADAPPRLNVGVIGTGRAGSVLGAALRRAGHPVVAAHGVSDLSRVRAEALLPGVELTDPLTVIERADLVLLTVRDDSLAEVVHGLAVQGAIRVGQLFMHASGRYGVEVLDEITRCGALPLALHPVMTFTGTSIDLARLDGCPFGVTSPDALRPIAEALVVEMGGEPVWVPEESRALYHAALAHGSNHLMALVAQTLGVLAEAKIEDPTRLVGPLLHASLDNTLRMGDQSLTGPVARGDARTVRAHLDVLREMSPDVLTTYIALARTTADRALAAGVLRAEGAQALLEVLSDEEAR